ALAGWVLGCDADRAFVGVTALGLDAAECEHESASRIAPVRTERHGAGDIEPGKDLAAGAELDMFPDIDPDQGIVNKIEPFTQRHTDVVNELERCRTGTPFLAVDHYEIRVNAGGEHGLANRQEFPRMPDAKLKSGRLPARQPPHLA